MHRLFHSSHNSSSFKVPVSSVSLCLCLESRAFISILHDYCNSLCFSITRPLLSRLQLLQMTFRLLTSYIIRNHITLIITSLHWHPASSRYSALPSFSVAFPFRLPFDLLPINTFKIQLKLYLCQFVPQFVHFLLSTFARLL